MKTLLWLAVISKEFEEFCLGMRSIRLFHSTKLFASLLKFAGFLFLVLIGIPEAYFGQALRYEVFVC